MSGSWNVSQENPSCHDNLTAWEQKMETMYTYFYLLLFIPGLLLNTIALWVLCKYISKKTKAVIFMINLSFADLAHILSLPLRIYYYFTHTWPFGRGMCLFCFYLKYLNMYAAIFFLVCISMQRCIFLLDPFCARRWRRRYDLLISFIVWVVVSLGCSPFILMRSSNSGNSTSSILITQTVFNQSYSTDAMPVQNSLGHKFYSTTVSTTVNMSTSYSSPSSTKGGCFKDLPMRRLPHSLAITMMTLAELSGFLIPLVCIIYSSIRIAWSLNARHNQDCQNPTTTNSSTRSRILSVTSVNGQIDNNRERQSNGEKRRALRMVLSCTALFLFCFGPYHVNFLLYLMVSQDIISNCTTRLIVRQFHPVSLCLASLSCCLNPLLYYFLTAEFRQHLAIRTSSFSSSLISSPSSPTYRPAQQRLMSMESNISE